MPCGLNQIVSWTRYTFDPDDARGGSVPTGTVINPSLLVRIEPIEPTMALLEQGLETVKLFRVAVGYAGRDMQENDELIVNEPKESWYINQSFRVISVRHPSLRPNDPRSQVQVTVRRWDKAHGRQP